MPKRKAVPDDFFEKPQRAKAAKNQRTKKAHVTVYFAEETVVALDKARAVLRLKRIRRSRSDLVEALVLEGLRSLRLPKLLR